MIDKTYLEHALPPYLKNALSRYKRACGETAYKHLDCDYCELQSCINAAEITGSISEDTAWYLREKYLGLKK